MKRKPDIQIDRADCWPNRMHEDDLGDIKGCVATNHGFVKVGRSLSIGGDQILLEFIYNGYEYSKWIYRYYTQRYIVTLAKRFADDVVNQKVTST